MDLIRFSIQRPVTVTVGALLIVLFGIISLVQIPIQLTPNIETLIVSVRTRWVGASPQEIENEVIRRQEDRLQAIPGVEKMLSNCYMGSGEVILEFGIDTLKSEALREVSDRLREVTNYPADMDQPEVRALNPQDRDPMFRFHITSTDPNYDVRWLGDYCEQQLIPELERVPGVSEVTVRGEFIREVHVEVDPVRLAQHGLTYRKLIDTLRSQNRSGSAGRLAEGKKDIRLRAVGRYESPEQIGNELLSEPGDPVVRVKDIGEVKLTFREPERMARASGINAITFSGMKDAGANIMEVMEEFRKRLDYVRDVMLPAEARRLGLNGGFELVQTSDQTIYIDRAIDLVQQNLWVGGSIAVMVLLLFLRSLRATLVIAIAIPVSVIGTFVAMTVLGRNINVISLAGLAFAVGMVVDNAIVVLENIDRHRKMHEGPGDASYRATKEVWGAVLASTLTTVAVFIPVLTVKEEAGQLFRDIAIAICASVLLSLLISVTVIPMLAARFMGEGAGGKRRGGLRGMISSLFGLAVVLEWGVNLFARAIGVMCRSWVLRIVVIVGMTGLSLYGSWLLMPAASYLPRGNRNAVIAVMSTPPGYSLAQMSDIGHRIEEYMRPWIEAGEKLEAGEAVGELKPLLKMDRETGEMVKVDVPPIWGFLFISRSGSEAFMVMQSSDDDRIEPVVDLATSAIAQIPGVRGRAFQSSLFRTARRGVGSGIELELVGQDMGELSFAATSLKNELTGLFGGPNVRASPSDYDLPGQEVRVVRRPVEASDLGLSQQDIIDATQVLGDGAMAGEYIYHGDTIDVRVRAKGMGVGDATYLRDAPIVSPMGQVVPLSMVAEIRRTVSQESISRVEKQRSIALQISLPEDKPVEEAMVLIEDVIERQRAAGLVPPTVRHELAGVAAKLNEVKSSLLGDWEGWTMGSVYSLVTSRLFLALLVVFLLMAALFEDWLYPVVIMFSVPLATVGGFMGLAIMRLYVPSQQLDILSMLGFVILVGVVVNNAILIVHQTLNLMRGLAHVEGQEGDGGGLDPVDAIALAVKSRVRPIFMSMLTSVGGMAPLALFPGAGSELYRGLGSVVVGGLVVSTVFTLLLVPLMLSVMFDVRRYLGVSARFVAGLAGGGVSVSD